MWQIHIGKGKAGIIVKKVYVLGGAGFLGRFTILELLDKSYEVHGVSLPPQPNDDILPASVNMEYIDFFELSDDEIVDKLKGIYAFFYAGGVDERIAPDIPASKFFYEKNVLPTQRIARLAKAAGVEKFIVYGSYTAYFAEKWPDLDYRTVNGYPRTRLLQEEVAYLEGGGGMDVMVLRLPYIFGTMPGVMPLWKMFVDQIKGQETYYAPIGGTAMVTVEQVAQAAVGAMEYGKHETSYALGALNMKYHRFYEIIAECLGQKTSIMPVSLDAIMPQMEQIDEQTRQAGKEHGIHMKYTAMFQDRESYVDPEDTMPVLKYKEMDVEQRIRDTIDWCIKIEENG